MIYHKSLRQIREIVKEYQYRAHEDLILADLWLDEILSDKGSIISTNVRFKLNKVIK